MTIPSLEQLNSSPSPRPLERRLYLREMSGTMKSSSTSCFIVRSPPGCTRSGGFCTSLTRTMGATLSLKVEDILNKFSRNKRCNGLNSVVRIQAHSTTVCKLLKRLVPGAGFEPAPSYEERILSPLAGLNM